MVLMLCILRLKNKEDMAHYFKTIMSLVEEKAETI